jgi:hypothetical protein
MMKSVHHVIDFTEVAHRRYWRDNGEQAPMPASGYEAAEHDGKSLSWCPTSTARSRFIGLISASGTG